MTPIVGVSYRNWKKKFRTLLGAEGRPCLKIYFSSAYKAEKDSSKCDCDNKIDEIVESYSYGAHSDHGTTSNETGSQFKYVHYFRLN